jgi:hypothetical protein
MAHTHKFCASGMTKFLVCRSLRPLGTAVGVTRCGSATRAFVGVLVGDAERLEGGADDGEAPCVCLGGLGARKLILNDTI